MLASPQFTKRSEQETAAGRFAFQETAMMRKPGQPVLDSFTLTGAEELAARIRRYWISRGYDVDVRVCTTRTSQIGTVACVRSDTINGFPRRRSQALAA